MACSWSKPALLARSSSQDTSVELKPLSSVGLLAPVCLYLIRLAGGCHSIISKLKCFMGSHLFWTDPKPCSFLDPFKKQTNKQKTWHWVQTGLSSLCGRGEAWTSGPVSVSWTLRVQACTLLVLCSAGAGDQTQGFLRANPLPADCTPALLVTFIKLIPVGVLYNLRWKVCGILFLTECYKHHQFTPEIYSL